MRRPCVTVDLVITPLGSDVSDGTEAATSAIAAEFGATRDDQDRVGGLDAGCCVEVLDGIAETEETGRTTETGIVELSDDLGGESTNDIVLRANCDSGEIDGI